MNFGGLGLIVLVKSVSLANIVKKVRPTGSPKFLLHKNFFYAVNVKIQMLRKVTKIHNNGINSNALLWALFCVKCVILIFFNY